MANIPGQGAFMDPQRLVSALGVVQGMKVADLGCGSGFIPLAFARAVGAEGVVTAVDVRQEPLDAVLARAEAAGMTNVRPVRGNLEAPGGSGIADGSHDIALLANVLYQSQQKEAILKEAVRVLRPGGRLVIVEWRKGVAGFGPPDELRTSEDAMKRLAEAAGVRFERPMDAGQYFYGLVFAKP